MLATVLWLGGLATISLWIIPSFRDSLSPNDYADWLARLNDRLNSIGWLSIGLLTVTGLVQMGANPSYTGLFSIANNWAIAILLKHLAFFGMIAVSAYITWGLNPALQHAALLRVRDGHNDKEELLLARLPRLIALNLLLGSIALALTALARIS